MATDPGPLNDLRNAAALKAATHPELVAEYLDYWAALTAQPRPPHLQRRADIENARAIMLGLLIAEAPIETVKEVLNR